MHSGAPVYIGGGVTYCNGFVTMCNMLGEKKQVIMVTSNPLFSPDMPNTPAAKQKWIKNQKDLLDRGIDQKHIICLADGPKFTRESQKAMDIYFERYGVPPHSCILTDCCSAFPKNYYTNKGFSVHVYYESSIHGVQSVNDNMWHADAANRWKAKVPNFRDDMHSSITLLKELQNVPQDFLRKQWVRNWMLECLKPSVQECLQLFLTRQSAIKNARNELHGMCKNTYLERVLGEPKRFVVHLTKELCEL